MHESVVGTIYPNMDGMLKNGLQQDYFMAAGGGNEDGRYRFFCRFF